MVAPNKDPQDVKTAGERVAKVIARSGLCSRREAEGLIEQRRVSVNGALIESAALDISPSDIVLVDGRPLATREPPRLWRYHKPKGRVTTHKDPEGRPTVFEALPENLPRLISVGRLDFNTEGLLLLTNDGDLARHIELPSTGWARRYRVRAYGQVTEAQLQDLKGGLTIDRMSYGPIEASLEREQGDNVWITVLIREGKNREVRRIMEHLGLTVNRLIRVSFGPFILGDLTAGQIEEVKTAVLKDQLGPRLSRQLGVRREIPREERRLAPGRAKPTYLRRKPVEVRPERAEEERPLKRRRILPMDGSEAPKVEFVAEKKPRGDRFAKRGERGENAPSRSAGREGGREPRAERVEKTPRGEGFETRPRPDADFQREKPEQRERGASYSKSHEAGRRERPERRTSHSVRSEGRDLAAGDAPRFRKFRSEQQGVGPRRFEAAGDGAPRERGPRKDFERRGEGPRPQRRFEAAGNSAPRERGPRKDFEHRGEGPRPQRRFEAGGDSAPRERGPREEGAGRTPRPSFRHSAEGGRKPFKARDGGERPFGRSGGDRPGGKRGEGKPMRSAGKPAHGRHSGGPRKPGPRPRPDKDKP
ncbi:MAG: pseudouridine synthase [Rhodomicrobium sp.]